MIRKSAAVIVASVIFIACNNSSESAGNPATDAPKTKEDSLYKDVMDAHDVSMGSMGKLKGYTDLVKQQLDSIAKLPARAQEAAAMYKTSLDSLLESLQYADMAMDKWMSEFVPDSGSNNMDIRIPYLESEKMKATKMKENVLSSIEKAKEVLKK